MHLLALEVDCKGFVIFYDGLSHGRTHAMYMSSRAILLHQLNIVH